MTLARLTCLAAISLAVGCPGCSKSSVVPRTQPGVTATGPAGTLPASALKVIPDERFSFRLSALGFDAGELVMAAGRPGVVKGKRTIFYQSRGVTTGVVALLKTVTDNVQCWIDLDTGTPTYHRNDSVIRSKFGGNKTDEGVEVQFDARPLVIREWSPSEGDTAVEQTLPGDVRPYDMTSALMAMRGWDAAKGARASYYVMRSSRFWQVHIEHGGRSSVKTRLGRFAAVRLDGVTRRINLDGTLRSEKDPRYFSIWYSDDELRLPLKIAAKTDVGDVTMELVEYVGGGREVARP